MNVIDERYVNGKIYKIVCNLTGEVYYGSTIQKLNYRISGHKCSLGCESRLIINRNNYYYVLIENYSCNNKKELETRERWYVENNDCINKIIPTRTMKEWKEDNKEKIQVRDKIYREKIKDQSGEYKKEWYIQNKEQILEKAKEKIPCDICGSIVRKSDIVRHRRTKFCLSKIDG